MWDERYEEPGYAYGERPNDFLVEAVARLPRRGGTALCLADGEGRNGVYLAEQGFAVTSVDLSAVGLRKARALAAQRGVELTTVHADLADFDLGRSAWDLVVSIFVHLPEELRRRLHAGVAPSLRPGGHFILEGYTPANVGRGVGGPPSVALTFSAAELQEELAALTLLRCEERKRPIEEGRLHRGLSAVVQLVGRKE